MGAGGSYYVFKYKCHNYRPTIYTKAYDDIDKKFVLNRFIHDQPALYLILGNPQTHLGS
jgi:virulence-associated protein VapD